MKILLLLLVMFPIYSTTSPQLQRAADVLQEIINNNGLAYSMQLSNTTHRIVPKGTSDQIIGPIFDALAQDTVVDLVLIQEMLDMLFQHHIILTRLEDFSYLADYLAQGILTVPQQPDLDFLMFPGEEGRLWLRLKDYLNSCDSLLQEIFVSLHGPSDTQTTTEASDPLVKIQRMLDHIQSQDCKKYCEIFFGDHPFILLTPTMCTYLIQLLLQICQNNPETDFTQLFGTIKRLNILFRTCAPSECEYFILDCRLELSCLEQELQRVDYELYQDYLNQRAASGEPNSPYSSALYKVLTIATNYCHEMQQRALDILNTVLSDSRPVTHYGTEEILAR